MGAKIINIAGTSGAGKTYLMRRVFKLAEYRQPFGDSKKPLGYDIRLPKVAREVHVVGSYENAPTSGCDTVKEISAVFSRVLNAYNEGQHVLYEGLFVMNMTRGPGLVRTLEAKTMHVIVLTTPLAECIRSINLRRAASGEGPLATRSNTEDNHRRARNYGAVMRDAGAAVDFLSRDQALDRLLEILRTAR